MSEASMFDPDSFLSSQTEQASVKRPPLAAGRDFIGTIKEIKGRRWTGKEDPTKSGIAFDVTVEFDLNQDPAEKARLGGGLEKVLITDGIMISVTEDGKSIDYSPGKNPRLRQYREATQLNQPGVPFSPLMMKGRVVRCKIKHEPYQGDIYDKIDAVAKV